MGTTLDIALEIARQGWPVFPAGASKRPAIAGGHGFLDAVRLPEEIESLFSQAPTAPLVGVPTGQISGFDILDIDYRHGGAKWENANLYRLVETRIHQSQSGGRHYLFRHAPGVRNSASKLADGIDIRGDGGYVIVPPSPGYIIIHDAEIAEWPDWLLEAVLARKVQDEQQPTAAPFDASRISSARLEGLRNSLVNKVAGASDGAKHYTLRNAALSLGGICAAAGIGDEEAVGMLMAALPATVKDRKNARATAEWGIKAGRARPIQLPDRPQYANGYTRPFGFGAEVNGHSYAYDEADAPVTATETPEQPKISPILTAAEFMAGFVPPDYIVDGIIQRGRLYSLTSPTGHGKTAVALYIACMIAIGRNIGAIEVVQAPVVFLAGENPDDLRCRMYAACQVYGIDPAGLPLHVLPATFPMTLETAETLKRQINDLECEPAMIVVDTAAAFFPGDDDNQNVQMGAYARTLRVLTTCAGGPAVMTPAHPIKNPDKENLLPRGGGAFLNEVDGNLTLWAQVMGEVTIMHWQGKIRGADFSPVNFALQQVKINSLTDSRGRPINSIVAVLQTDEQAEAVGRSAVSDENTVLEWLRRHPGISLKDIANNAGWTSVAGVPNKAKVHRLMKSLQREKLASLHRGKWIITEAGKKELEKP